MDRKRILWITQTAIFIALLVSAQHITAPMSQFVTGSIVNFILVAATILVGVSSGVVVGGFSPIFAYMILGVPLFPVIIPFIMAGNAVLVIAVHIISVKSYENLGLVSYVRIVTAVIAGSVLKFLVLWIGVVYIALPFLIPNALPPQVAAMSLAFSWPQLVTALIGSGVAMASMPHLTRALGRNRSS